ncbi:hypothetical protein [Photorhabdus stackebrandtii]|uniref:hypothetical protein n=1 Tax=Photorhabdus stackebrandtii TaxID=1123042 RepID=UPI001F60FF35|nr:hypothetical protein [Photorhabdus stackebrandtii]
MPVEFRNYLSAVNTLSQAVTGKVGELSWSKRFEAMGMNPETTQAMAMTLPIVMEGAKGSKSLPKSSQNNAGKGAQSESVGKNTSGAENVATYPKLKEDLNRQNLNNIAKQDPRLGAAIKGSGTRNPNFSVGSGTQKEADRLGKIWVGDGAKLTTDGKGWVNADGTRVYRFPKEKPNTPAEFTNTGIQANFEILKDGKRVSNGHM